LIRLCSILVPAFLACGSFRRQAAPKHYERFGALKSPYRQISTSRRGPSAVPVSPRSSERTGTYAPFHIISTLGAPIACAAAHGLASAANRVYLPKLSL
jgi:hypothetical protein